MPGKVISHARQRIAVSQGIALGLLTLGRSALPFERARLDTAFLIGWRAWVHRPVFPIIDGDLTHGSSGSAVITHAGASDAAGAPYWERGGRLTVRCPTGSLPSAEELDAMAQAVAGGLTAADWQRLASAFLVAFETRRLGEPDVAG